MRRLLWLMAIAALTPALAPAQAESLAYDGAAVTYALVRKGFVTVDVHTSDGEHRAAVWAGEQAAGRQSVAWNGADDAGRPLPKGEYILRLRFGRASDRDRTFGGKKGFAQFTHPTCIRTDAQGNLYVVDVLKSGEAIGSGESELRKLSPEGDAVADFPRWRGAKPTEPRVPARKLPRFAIWALVTGDRTILYNDQNRIAVTEYSSKLIRHVGGFEWTLDADGGMRPKPGSAWPTYGAAFGPGNTLYVRDERAVRAFDWTKPGGEGYRYSSDEDLDLPPVPGVKIGPCIAADMGGRIYVTGQGGLWRFTDTGKVIRRDYRAEFPFKEYMGVAVGRDGMIYVVDRGIATAMEPLRSIVDSRASGIKPPKPSPRICQFWDDGRRLNAVWQIEDRDLAGLHDVAVSPDGLALYAAEDGDDYGRRGGGSRYVAACWPDRALPGKGRVFKYNLRTAQEIRKTINLK